MKVHVWHICDISLLPWIFLVRRSQCNVVLATIEYICGSCIVDMVIVWRETAVTPLLMHWGYCSCVLIHIEWFRHLLGCGFCFWYENNVIFILELFWYWNRKSLRELVQYCGYCCPSWLLASPKWSQCVGYDYMACMDCMDPNVCSPKKAIKLCHSLTHSLNRQVISTHGIDYAEWTVSLLPGGNISTTCAIWMLKNDQKCKYIFLCFLKYIPVGNIKTYLHFLSCRNTEMAQVCETLPHGGQGAKHPATLNTMVADVLATQGARASSAMVLT